MNILRRKRSQSEKEETEFQSSQLIPLSSMGNYPGYPTVTGTFSLASGTYDEVVFMLQKNFMAFIFLLLLVHLVIQGIGIWLHLKQM